MSQPLLIAKSEHDVFLLPGMANRHGLITGATGTGKTVTLQRMAESFSAIGVPVFVADVKGDLSGISQPGELTPKLKQRLDGLKLTVPEFAACPATFWDVFAGQGSPVRTTVSELGPLLLSRILELNDTQEGVLSLVFKACDDNGLLLLDLKDLRALSSTSGTTPSSSPPATGTYPPPASAPSSAGCSRWSSKAATSCSASPRSTCPICCRRTMGAV